MMLRSRTAKKARIEIIPMIDVVFFLLVFFMMASLAMTIYQGLPGEPARGGQRAAGGGRDRVHHRVRETGRRTSTASRWPWRRFPRGCAPLLAANRELAVVINADREVAHARVVDVLDELRGSG